MNIFYGVITIVLLLALLVDEKPESKKIKAFCFAASLIALLINNSLPLFLN